MARQRHVRPMTMHLLKLCVGAESVEDHREWIEERLAVRRAQGEAMELCHTTRMVPRLIDEVLDGGSLYWVTKGWVQSRQKIIDIRPFTDDDGIGRCHLVLSPELVLTRPTPRRPFQGWRYLKPDEAPADLSMGETAGVDMPAAMRAELAALGLM